MSLRIRALRSKYLNLFNGFTVTAVLYVEVSTKIEKSKSLTMRFVRIVASGVVSGSY
jgi:hypothetical protein